MAKDTQTKVIRIVISENSKSRQVVYKTPLKGVKTRTGKQAYSSVTKHESKYPKKTKDAEKKESAE